MNPGNWTLRARLIALVVALLTLTSLVIGGVMFVVMQRALSEQLDSTVRNAASRFGPQGDGGSSGYQDVGTVAAFFSSDGAAAEGRFFATTRSNPGVELDSAQLRVLAGLRPGDAQNIAVPKHGDYRFIAERRVLPIGFAGETVGTFVVGLPLSNLYRQTAALAATIVGVVLGAIGLAALLAALIIRRALRPLSRVARVASDVSRMRLDEGDVQLAERVPAYDTNPHTEVGKVGVALNGLLDTVGGALDKRQASEAKLRTFVADASHELRTPLASIRGYAELTRRFGGPLGDDAQHNIGRIESEVQRMTSLVEDLLLLARLDAQRELEERDVDLSRLLVDVVSDAHAAGRDHRWDLDIPDEPVVVRGDDPRLHQVFTNLLANARLHTPPGTRVTVELRRPAADEAVVVVRDGGPGIPEEIQPTLFERFVRGDSSRNRNTGSTGLGLSIVSAVVQAHHGSVAVASRPGETAFTVRLPLHQPAPQRAVTPEPVAT